MDETANGEANGVEIIEEGELTRVAFFADAGDGRLTVDAKSFFDVGEIGEQIRSKKRGVFVLQSWLARKMCNRN
jgi:hypothetical protein